MRSSAWPLRGQHQDRHRRIGAHRLGQIEAGFAGHHHVEDEQIEGHAFHQRARVGRVRRRADAKAVGRKIAMQQRAQPFVVVDDQKVGVLQDRQRSWFLRPSAAKPCSTLRKPFTASWPAAL